MRKISANYIFTGSEFIRNGVVTIDHNGKILSINSLGEFPLEEESTEFYNGILTPGFVNTHSHIELSHMLGKIPNSIGMSGFCKNIIQSRNYCDESAQLESIAKYDKEMYDEGIVAVGDISNSTSSFNTKAKSAIYYHTFIECLGVAEEKKDVILQQALSNEELASRLGLSSSITGHAPYSMSEPLLRDALLEGSRKKLLSMHNQESRDEVELFQNKTGNFIQAFGNDIELFVRKYTSPLERNLRYVKKDSKILLVHNTYTSKEDVEYATNLHPKIYWALCPRSNLYIENRLPDLRMFYHKGVKITLGTDSLSSNYSLLMLEEVKTIQENFPELPMSSLLKWATLNGAEALGIEDKYGSLTLGKTPGICLIDNINFDNLSLTPLSKSKKII